MLSIMCNTVFFGLSQAAATTTAKAPHSVTSLTASDYVHRLTWRALAIRPGDAVLQIRRMLSFVGTPTILEDLWLPAAPFKGLTVERLADYDGPMYGLFETEFGACMVSAEEKIRAVLPDSEQSKLLQIAAQKTPLLSVERIAYTYNIDTAR
jgi:DNA-binding GntR family transcriptional regulator